MNMTLKFSEEKETKNTVRYAEVHSEAEHAVIGTLYISKPALAKLGNPTELTVTIDA